MFAYKLYNYINEPFFSRQIDYKMNNYNIRFDIKDYDSIIIFSDCPLPKQLNKEDSTLFYKEYLKATERVEIQDAIMDAETIIVYIKQGKFIIEPWDSHYGKIGIDFGGKRISITKYKIFRVTQYLDKSINYKIMMLKEVN
ncbi:MAG: hypothetical protein R2760_07240 [Chitinophagales bacterium]